MLSRDRLVASFVFGALFASCIALTGKSLAESRDSVTGVFVSYGVDRSGASLTVEQDGHLAIYGLAADAIARELAGGETWQTTSPAALAQGEPVTLHLGPDGMVRQVDAVYAIVITRLVVRNNGYVVTTAGDAYKLVGRAASFQSPLDIGTYLKLRVDPQRNVAFDITASSEPFTGGSLARPVTVTFTVTVPTNTPTTDIIYLASDATNWIPNGVRMSPLTGNRWSAALTLGQGSSLKYKYTRGTWATAESNAAGVEVPNRSLSLTKTEDTQQVNDAVVRWSDLPS